MSGLGETFDLYQRAMASSTRALDVLNSELELKDGSYKPEIDLIKQSDFVFSDVSFAYRDRDLTFEKLNLTITALHEQHHHEYQRRDQAVHQ